MHLNARAPRATVEKTQWRIPWDLKVADIMEMYPVPRDAELNFFRGFSPWSWLSKVVSGELILTGAMVKFTRREAFLEQRRKV